MLTPKEQLQIICKGVHQCVNEEELLMPIFEGIDGIEKMSKNLGNYIEVNEPAKIMFKKVMEIPDDLLIKCYEVVTEGYPDKIEKIKIELSRGVNPLTIKMQLAETITRLYHTQVDVQKAISYYEKTYSKKAIPDNIPTLLLDTDKDTVKDIIPQLIVMEFIRSKSEFHRLVEQREIQINNEKIAEDELGAVLYNNDVIKSGNKFIKIVK